MSETANSQQAAQPASGTPPQAAETVASGKSEREARLERENNALKKAVTATAASKRKVETENAYLANENHRLKQIPKANVTEHPSPATSKELAWGFFGRA
jgi:hypothetical protein